MPNTSTRRSPLHDLLAAVGAEFREHGGGSFAINLTSNGMPDTLAVCDLSALNKYGVKGPDAESWLTDKGLDVPASIFASSQLAAGGVIARLGSDEFFFEDGIDNTLLPSLAKRAAAHRGQLFPVEHQEATFLLIGSRAREVLAQTCGINFDEAPLGDIIFTRVAGVSCGVFPQLVDARLAYRMWIAPNYAVYLWQTLVEICESLGGAVIGADHVFPELRS